MNRVICIGMGPGGAAWVTPEAHEAMRRVPIVLGEARFLQLVQGDVRRETLPTGTGATVARIQTLLEEGDVGVLVSGDPSFFSLGNALVRDLGLERVQLVPGVSSLQLLAARVGRSWANVPVTTLHGREAAEIAPPVGDAVFLLGGIDRVPGQLRLLAQVFGEHRSAALGWDLGLENEQITHATLGELAALPPSGRLPILWIFP